MQTRPNQTRRFHRSQGGRLPDSTLLYIPLLAVMACENATAPNPPDPEDAAPSTPVAEPTSHTPIVLRDGVMMSLNGIVTVSDQGSVFSSILHGSGTERAAKWTVETNGHHTHPVLLGTLPAPFQNASQLVESTSAAGDVVVGYAYNVGGNSVAWLWSDGSMRLLPLPQGAFRATARGVNDAGTVVGQVGIGHGDYAAVWLPPYDADPVLLPRFGACLNTARGITNTGVVTGMARCGPDVIVQWRIDQEGAVLSGPEKLAGSDGFFLLGARTRDAAGTFGAMASVFRFDEARRVDLGALAGHNRSMAIAVSGRAKDDIVHAVGQSLPTGTQLSATRAVLWTVDSSGTVTGPVDIGLPRTGLDGPNLFHAALAHTINSQGWIGGQSRLADGTMFATLWLPRAD